LNTPDTDPIEAQAYFSGYDFWLTNLNRFNGNFVQAERVKAFICSSEHGTRFVCQKCHSNDRRLRAIECLDVQAGRQFFGIQ
jgi:hypothetical protein